MRALRPHRHRYGAARSSAGQRCAPGGRSPHDPRPRRPHRGLRRSRRFNELQGAHIPVYADPGTASMLPSDMPIPSPTFSRSMVANRICFCTRSMGHLSSSAEKIVPIPVLHGRLPITGFRFGDLAYITDAKEIPAPSLDLLRDLDVLVLNGLRVRSHRPISASPKQSRSSKLCGLGSPAWFTCRTRRVTPRLNDSSAPESRSPGTVWSSRPATVNSSSGPSHRGNRLSARLGCSSVRASGRPNYETSNHPAFAMIDTSTLGLVNASRAARRLLSGLQEEVRPGQSDRQLGRAMAHNHVDVAGIRPGSRR